MKILLKSCKIVSKSSPFNGKTKDILIQDGIISKIKDQITDKVDQVFNHPDLHISIGWYDSKVNFCDPGFEYKEDLYSGLKAAEAGGMTAVSVTPNTNPPISSKAQVEYVLNNSSFSPVDIYPLGTITHNLKGEELAEMYDIKTAGAVAFTDYKKDTSAGIMYRALLYAKNFDGLVISFPFDKTLFGEGQVNEGNVSVMTGLKSIPSLSETIKIQRDLSILEYTGGRLHISGVSTKEGCDMIQKAKKKGLQVTADVHINNLIFNEDKLLGFDVQMKVLPPLRTEEDRQALINALKEGTIDVICSDHSPENIENKDVEFDHAAFGVIGTQTLFPLLNTLSELSLEEKISAISENPRAIYGLDTLKIEEGAIANITLFTPNEEWTLTEDKILSKSKNTALIDQKLNGKVLGVVNNGILSVLE
jgi:dihydroorotase